MDLWLTPDGDLAKNEDGELLKCDDCPCVAGCDAYASSYVITNPFFFTSCSVTATTSASLACTSYSDVASIYAYWDSQVVGTLDPNLICYWQGTAVGGSFNGNILTLHGLSDQSITGWVIGRCFASVVVAENNNSDPAGGTYTNSYDVS